MAVTAVGGGLHAGSPAGDRPTVHTSAGDPRRSVLLAISDGLDRQQAPQQHIFQARPHKCDHDSRSEGGGGGAGHGGGLVARRGHRLAPQKRH